MTFGFNILKEHTDYFGLDIGTTSLKAVQLRKALSGKFELISFGSQPLENNISQSDSDVDKKRVAETVKKLVHSMHLVTKNVMVSLPGDSVFTTVITLPKMPPSELKKAIGYQAEQNIPLKISEVKIDWHIIGEIPAKNEILVMVIAAPMTKTQKMVDITNEAGLELGAVEINAIASARALQTAEPLYMIVDVGTFRTEVVVVKNGIVSLTRAISIGGQVITRAIAQSLGLEEVQAEQFKRKFGIAKDKMEGQIYKASRSVLDNLKEEIDRSIKYYSEQFGESIPFVKLTGGGSRLIGMQEFLAEGLELNVVYGNPWNMVIYKPDIASQLNLNAQDFAVAIGLAMRGF
jgi:type IV pilus assembly protein PilM